MPLSNMSDRLKKIAEERDASAFRSIFLTFGPKVRAMLMRQGADCDMAEDIVQETMLTVWCKAHLFTREKGAISTWIYTIARNLRIDRLRRQLVWDDFRDDLQQFQDTGAATDESLVHKQHCMEVTKALGSLPTEQLQIIQLSFVDGLTQSEIASRLQLPLGTVKSRMRLAFEKLRSSVGSSA